MMAMGCQDFAMCWTAALCSLWLSIDASVSIAMFHNTDINAIPLMSSTHINVNRKDNEKKQFASISTNFGIPMDMYIELMGSMKY